MSHIHLIVGPVAAGKSTLALRLEREHRAVRMNLDEWMAELFAQDRPEGEVLEWYVERSQRCLDLIWKLTTRVIDAGANAVLEIGLIQQCDRQRLYERVEVIGCGLTIYVLDAPRGLRRERVQRRNLHQGETFSMVVPPHIFELASDMWEPLDEVECSGRDVRFLSAD